MLKTRKLQLTGESTFVVSLPKAWIKKNKLAKGAEVHIEETSDGMIKIHTQSPVRVPMKMQFHVDSSTKPDWMVRSLLSAYLNGFSIIEVSSQKPIPSNVRKAIVAQVEKMMGFEIVEEKQDRILMQDFFTHTGVSLDKTLRRVHMLLSKMQNDFWIGLSTGDTSCMHEVMEIETEVDRLTFMVKRQLRHALADSALLESLNLGSQSVAGYFITFELVERIADRLNTSAEEIIQMPSIAPPADVLPSLKVANDFSFRMHEGAIKAFFADDKSAANELIDENTLFHSHRINLMQKLFSTKGPKSSGSAILSRYFEMSTLGSDICEVVIDAIESPLPAVA